VRGDELQRAEESYRLHDAIDMAARERDRAIDKASRKRVDERLKYRKAKFSEIYYLKQSLSKARFKAATQWQEK